LEESQEKKFLIVAGEMMREKRSGKGKKKLHLAGLEKKRISLKIATARRGGESLLACNARKKNTP